MPPVPETSAGPAEPAVANDYDSFAQAYTAETEANLVNAHYERPAILDLAGDVAGRRILDAGCGLRGGGVGDLSAWRTIRLPAPYLSASARADRPCSLASRRMSVNSSAFGRLLWRESGMREAVPAGGSWSASACCREMTGMPG